MPVVRRIFALHATFFALYLLGGCAPDGAPAGPRLVEKAFVSMGSSLKVSIWATDNAKAAAAADAVYREFDRLDSLLSTWKDGSDAVRINKAAGIEPVQVSRETLDVLQAAREASRMTGGKFDVTFGALSGIWKFDHDQDNSVPSRFTIDALLPLVNWQDLEVNPAAGTAFLKRKGMRVHLGGIGKGYAVDRAVGMLREQGFVDFLIQSGGDMYAAGTNNGSPWRLGIADPRGAHDAFAAVEIRDATFSTSGDYERAFVRNGVRYHHILDPDTGVPAREARSVTVVAKSAMLADVLSTGVFIMGPGGFRLIEDLRDVEGVMVTGDNRLLVSSGLKDRLDITGAPTSAP